CRFSYGKESRLDRRTRGGGLFFWPPCFDGVATMNDQTQVVAADIRLRAATAADIEPLYALHKAAYEEVCTKTWGPWDDGRQLELFRKNFDCAVRQIIEYRGEVAGYLDVERHEDHLWLAEIVIGPGYQRRGIGTYLVRELIGEAKRARVPLKLRVLKVN